VLRGLILRNVLLIYSLTRRLSPQKEDCNNDSKQSLAPCAEHGSLGSERKRFHIM